MTLRPDLTEPCWEIVRADTKRPPQEDYGDGWPHYPTETKAREALAAELDQWDEPLTVQQAFSRPCFGLFCDGPECPHGGKPADMSDEGWTHLDPAEPLPFGLDCMDWTTEERAGRPDKHYCSDCAPPWCDDCDEQHYGDCPDCEPRPAPVPVIPGQMTIEDVEVTA